MGSCPRGSSSRRPCRSRSCGIPTAMRPEIVRPWMTTDIRTINGFGCQLAPSCAPTTQERFTEFLLLGLAAMAPTCCTASHVSRCVRAPNAERPAIATAIPCASAARDRRPAYSHSMVLGGFELISYTTRLTPLTSLMIRFDARPSTSYGILTQSAVMKSGVSTQRIATTLW